MKYLKLNRVTKDIGLFGKKGVGKTTILVLLAYLENKYYGTKIYTNIKGLKIPNVYIDNIDDLDKVKNDEKKIFIGDDFERWFFSRNAGSKKNLQLLQLLLDWGKYSCSLYYSAKREMSIDIGLRESTIEFWEVELRQRIFSNSGSKEIDKLNNVILRKYADFLYIKINRFDENLNDLPCYRIFNLKHIFSHFDTKTIVKQL